MKNLFFVLLAVRIFIFLQSKIKLHFSFPYFETKKYCILIIFLIASFNLFAQNANKNNEGGVITCSEFHVTRPLREIVSEHPVDVNNIYDQEESEDREHRTPQKFRFSVRDGLQYGNDPAVVQKEMGHILSRGLIANWAGQGAGGARPFDPSGAAGPNHYVQMINATRFNVYNKSTGATLLTATLGSLWSPSTSNAGDPIVLYDKSADRWFLAQFGTSGNSIYIAISTSGDPTGSYYTYTFSSPQFPDYLKFSVWADGYYMTSNQSSQKVFAFERTAMLAGHANSRAIYKSFAPPDGTGFFIPLSGDASDGTLPTVGTPCPIFSYSDNGWGPGYSDAVNIYEMAVDWTPTTPTATINLAANVPTAAFDGTYDSNWDDVVQPHTTQKLDGIGGVCMFRAQWKSFDGYNTTVLNWAVQISSTQRSIKWCELRQDKISGVWTMYQEGIYTPDADTRWMGSIAMDNNGSIALCYLKSNATSIYPGLYYTGRRECDPLGTLPITETLVVSGTASQTGVNRDGDYADLVLDPDGITFWHTSEYMGGTTGGSAARTRIFSFQLASCTNIASVSIRQSSGTNPQCPGDSATFIATPYNGGSVPIYQWQVNGTNVGTNDPVYTASLTNGQVVSCIMTSNLPGVTGSPAASNNSITMVVQPVVTPSVSIALTAGGNPSCTGSLVVFTATPVNGGSTPTYQWKINGANVGTDSPTLSITSLTNGQVVSCNLTSSEFCTTSNTVSSNVITMTISAPVSPSVTIAQTGGTNPLCSGDSATFRATVTNGIAQSYQWKLNGINAGLNDAIFKTAPFTGTQTISCEIMASSNCSSFLINSLGTSTSVNSSNGSSANVGAAYPTYFGNGRQQYLVRASELTALGFSPGNISSLGFNITGSAGSPATLIGYTIKIAATTSNVMTSTFLTPVFSTVYGPVNYTPTLNSINSHQFINPFVWDGISNIVIDICFSNQANGNSAYHSYQSSSSFVSTAYYQVDGASGSGACNQAIGTGTGSKRPNMIFTIGSNTEQARSNDLILLVDSAVTPSVSISQSAGTNPMCSGTQVEFTAIPVNGGTAPIYQWKINNTNTGGNSPIYSSSSIADGDAINCIMTSNANCLGSNPATSNTIAMSVYPPVTIFSITQSGDTLFAPQGFNSYQWYYDSTLISGANDYFYYAEQNGNYSVLVTDSNGCDTTVQRVNVILSVNEVNQFISDFNVRYFSGNLYLQLNSSLASYSVIQLIDMIGREVYYKKVFIERGKNVIEFPVKNISGGNYFFRLINSNQSIVRKVFIQKD